MNKFLELKRTLDNKQVVERYLGLPIKSTSSGNWYKSFTREEKTASLLVSDKGIHDFGDSKHYDIIGFVSEYFRVGVYDAYKILCRDFNIEYLNDTETIEILKKQRAEEKAIKSKINNYYINKFIKLSDELIRIKKAINYLDINKYYRALMELYKQEAEIECEIERIIYMDDKAKEKMYIKEVIK